MTKEQALEKMRALADSGDTEMAHCEADDILCKFLTELGHADLVEAYDMVDKWYA